MQELLVILNYTTGKVIIINAPEFFDEEKDYSEHIEDYIAENYPES